MLPHKFLAPVVINAVVAAFEDRENDRFPFSRDIDAKKGS
jgi:hypothetical protein